MSENQENATNWNALACKGGYFVVVIYALSMIGITIIKYFTGYDYMFYNFLAGIVATVTILIGAHMINATESIPERQRQLTARMMSYHIMALLGILLLPFHNAPGTSSITVLVLLGIVFFGQAWMTDEEQESEAKKFFKNAWNHSGTALPALITLILIIGLWTTWGITAQTESVWKSIPDAFKKLEKIRKERIDQEATRDALVRAQKKDLLPFLNGSPSGSSPQMAHPTEGQYLDDANTLTVVSENNDSSVYRVESKSEPQHTRKQSPHTQQGQQFKTEVLGIQEPLLFLNASELESYSTGEISSNTIQLTVASPQGAQNLLLSGQGNGHSFMGTWRQGAVSGTFAAQIDGRLQVDLYSGNTRVAVIMVTI